MLDKSEDYSITEHTHTTHTHTHTGGECAGVSPDLIVDGQLFPTIIYLSKASVLPSASESLAVLPAGPLIQIKQDDCKRENRNYWKLILKADFQTIEKEAVRY